MISYNDLNKIAKDIKNKQYFPIVIYLLVAGLIFYAGYYFRSEPQQTITDSIQFAGTNNAPISNNSNNTTFNSVPEPVVAWRLISTSTLEKSGLYKTELTLHVGITPGARELTENSIQILGASCDHPVLEPLAKEQISRLVIMGPLTGRMQYIFRTKCLTDRPINGDTLPFGVNVIP